MLIELTSFEQSYKLVKLLLLGLQVTPINGRMGAQLIGAVVETVAELLEYQLEAL